MNVFGEGLPEEIIKQVNRRQKTYGTGYAGATRTNEDIIALNANTGWIKLLSSVNIDNLDNINNPSIKQLGLTGDALAKTYVLFNGTKGSTEIFRSGVSPVNTFGGDNYAYGIGGTEFGLNPMMGITSMTVNHENRGSLRRAVVKIRAHNKVQFEIIDVLYLRLGFQVLLEWGNSIYFDNNDKYEPLTTNNWSLADDFLRGSGNVKNDPPPGEKFKYFNYDDFLQRIHQNRLDSHGNYDAMFAKVTNFHWSVNKDGSYDIEVNLASIGDIIESLKINVASKSLILTKKQKLDLESEDIPKQQEFILSRKQSAIGDFLSMPLIETSQAEHEKVNHIIGEFSVAEATATGVAIVAIVGTGLAIPVVNIAVAAGIIVAAGIYLTVNAFFIANDDKSAGYIFFLHEQGSNTNDKWSSVPYLQLLNAKKSPPININMNLNNFNELFQRDFININWDNAMSNSLGIDATDPFTYVRLGTFLQFLQDVIVFQQKGVTVPSTAKPGLKFDYDVETNIINAYDRQVSFDPKICVVNRNINLNFNPGSKEYDTLKKYPYSFAPTHEGEAPSILPQDGGKYISDNLLSIGSYGKIMNVFVNSRFILEIIENNKDEQGDVILIDFLQRILDGISEGLGGLNNLDVFIDETLNTVKIIDKNPLKNKDAVLKYMLDNKHLFPYVHKDKSQKISTELAEFQLFGYSGSSAGFVKDFTFKTELTPAFSTMITVGAAANSSVVGEENTALSRINKGLVDRYKETVVNIIDPIKVKEESDKLETAIDDHTKLLKIRNEEFEKFLYDMSYTAEYYSILDGVEYNIDDINLHKTSLKELIDLEQKLKELIAKRDDNPPPPPSNTRDGFIPFNLSLTMDGLSGMKINEKFTVDTDFLPSNYPETVEFLIKNLTHEVADNKWLTKIDSYCISKQAEVSSVVKDPVIVKKDILPSEDTAPTPVKDVVTESVVTTPAVTKTSNDYSKTLTSGFPLERYIVSGRTDKGEWNVTGTPKIFTKTQIYLHHTAGWARNDKGKQTIDGWNGRSKTSQAKNTWATGGPYVIDREGHVEQLADDRFFYITQGSQFPKAKTNEIGIGIEVCNVGMAKLDKNGDWCVLNGSANISKNKNYGLINGIDGKNPLGIGNGISYLVDEDGKQILYNTHQYGVSYFPSQIKAIETLIRKLMKTHNIPFKWEGKKTYEQMFPNYDSTDKRYKSLNGNNRIPGIYTHRVVSPTTKVDLLPTKEIIEMLKNFK